MKSCDIHDCRRLYQIHSDQALKAAACWQKPVSTSSRWHDTGCGCCISWWNRLMWVVPILHRGQQYLWCCPAADVLSARILLRCFCRL